MRLILMAASVERVRAELVRLAHPLAATNSLSLLPLHTSLAVKCFKLCQIGFELIH